MDDMELQIRREFIAEASEMLETVESAFIELERHPDDVKVIDKIFRLAHTIKGSALSVGFTRLGEFAHVVETLLVRVREKKLTMNPEISDLLLRSNDRLAQFVAALSRDPDSSIDTKDIEEMIHEVLNRGAPATVTPVAATPVTLPTSDIAGFGFFDDEPTSAPKAAAPKNQDLVDLVSALADTGLKAYVELARLVQAEQPNRNAIQSVLTQFEKTLEECTRIHTALKEAG